MVSKDRKLSMRQQCALLTLMRSNLYYEPNGESAEQMRYRAVIDKQFLETPWYESRQMARHMKRNNYQCGRLRVRFAVLFKNESHKFDGLIEHPEAKIQTLCTSFFLSPSPFPGKY